MHKVTLLFEFGCAGWSETWYRDGTYVTEIEEQTRKLASARAKLLGTSVKIIAARITPLTSNRAPTLVPFNPHYEGQGPLADNMGSVIIADVSASEGYKRQMYLRGCPDDWIRRNNGVNAVWPEPLANAAMLNWLLALRAGLWRMQANNRTGAPAREGIPITSYALEGGFIRVNVTIPNLRPGDIVKIKKTKAPTSSQARAINRRHTVDSVGVGYFVTKVAVGLVPDYASLANGRAFTYSNTHPLVEDAFNYRVSRKKVGRCFFAPRGRRSKRR